MKKMIKRKNFEKFVEKVTVVIEDQDKRIGALYDSIQTLEGDEDFHSELLKGIDEILSEKADKLKEAILTALIIYSDLRQKELLSNEEVEAYTISVGNVIDYQTKLCGLLMTKLDILETTINK